MLIPSKLRHHNKLITVSTQNLKKILENGLHLTQNWGVQDNCTGI